MTSIDTKYAGGKHTYCDNMRNVREKKLRKFSNIYEKHSDTYLDNHLPQ
jgi:hypothetical protein